MNKLFSEMKTNVGNNIQDTSTNTATIIGRALNDSYFEILRRINWQNIDNDYTITTVAGTQDYVLPANFSKAISVYDRTNDIVIGQISLEELVDDYVGTIDSQTALGRYAILDKMVQQQPSASSALSIVSSSASDTTQTVFIRGISGGVEVNESVTATGTTPASTTNSYTEILLITKDSTSVGGITITANSGATTQAVIPPEAKVYRVKVIRLHGVPSSAVVLNIPYITKPMPLINDNDSTVLPIEDIIENFATAKMWRYKRQMAKAMEWEGVAEKSLIHEIWNKENQPNQVHQFTPTTYSRETV